MNYKPPNLQIPSASYTSFNLQPPRTPGRGSFPSVQVITRPVSIVLFAIIKQCTNPREAICLIQPRLNNLAACQDKSPRYISEKSAVEASEPPTIIITEEKTE